ncbi:MAG: FG-GAP-like repeat-containing protein, partial [Porphyromonadaceae bacterium]|nr:FG-GAP-like repeat-containing protein [Porphyromonadaceae bacterium]
MKNRIILLVFFITNVLCYAQQTSSIFDPPVKPPVIDIPITEINDNTVSAMPSNVDVTPMGAASYSIPIQVPPGTNGFQPNIAISYNSQAGFGAMGIGWNISGLSQIERGGKNFYHDGPKVEKNHITFTDEDQLYLDGQRLILLSGKHMKLGAVYGFEVENYARVTIKQIDFQQSNHGLCLELKTKEGAIIQYAANNYISYKGLNNNTLYWKISKSIDVHGNVINYEYSKDYRTLKRITYAKGANSIEFKYLPNDKNPQKKYIKNFELVNDSLLSSIQIKQGGVYVDKYKFNYEVADTYKRLVSIDYSVFKAFQVGKEPIFTTDQQTDSASTYPVQNHNTANNGTLSGFKYLNTTRIGWGENATLQNVEVESGFVPDYDRMYIGDIDGDGKNDYIYLNYSDNSDCYIRVKFRKTGKLQQIAFNKYSKQKPMVLIQDINLDGQDEVVLLYEKAYMHNIEFPNGELPEDYDIYFEQHTSYEKHLKLFAYDKRLNELVEMQDIKLTNFGEPSPPRYYNNYNIISAFFGYINDDIYPDLRILVDKPVGGEQSKVYIGEYVYRSGRLEPLYKTEFETVKSVPISDTKNWNKSVLGDFDGNGVLDLFHGKSTSLVNNVINYSDKFNIIESGVWRVWQIGHLSSSEGNDWIDRAVPYSIDIDGDNRTDMLIQYQEQNNHSWRVLMNNGINNIPKMEHINIIEASMTIEADNDYKIPIDYNGDGLMDFVVVDECHDPINKRERRFTHTKWWFYKNDNGKLVQDKVFITNYEISYKSNEERHPVVADINNDGVDDIVYYENGRIKAFTMYEANKANLVHKITNGLGKVYDISYKYNDNFESNESRNTELRYNINGVRILNIPLILVDQLWTNSKQNRNYTYGKILYHNTKGFMGFDKISTIDIFCEPKGCIPFTSKIETEMIFEPVGRNRYFNIML